MTVVDRARDHASTTDRQRIDHARPHHRSIGRGGDEVTITLGRIAPTTLVVAFLLSGCSTAPDSAPPTPSTTTAQAQQALSAYEEFWTVTDSAFAAPASRDWTERIEEVAVGQAREALQVDVANYASVPAHAEGAVTREPVVGEMTAERIEIVDCVDLGDSRLVADSTGDVLDDLENRVPRYRFRAELVLLDGRWVVERTAPSLGEPC
ncbi:hypothetical protein I4I84_06465 [Pseudonocardia sp. KRD-182]|uniref:hypothetical protein n=1 Tax=Pseudonocardia oceani TaxID=2792013 RepID=UPI001C4A0977|nr:hypothetical protein [Pseudonocardia oceani]MBW0108379.1 hypothetical protein [Pseudonocardia oceani]